MTHKFGIIGAGIMGSAVGRVLKNIPNVEICALCDPSRERLEASGKEFGVTAFYTNHKDMLAKEKLDAVAVATPDNFHREPVIDALQAGCHVYVEKPLATSQADAEEMARVVKKTGKKLQVDFNHRWLSPYHKVREMIEAGKLGEPLIGFARKNNPISVPTQMIKSWSARTTPAWFLSCHDIDLMTWWFDADPVEAYARGTKKVLIEKGFDTYDGIQSLVTYEGGKHATFEAVWIYPDSSPYMPDSFMEIIGSAGSLHLDRKAEAIDAILEAKFECPRTFLNYKVFEEWQGAFPAAVRSFLYAIEHDTEPHVNVRDGVRSTTVLEAVHKSLASGQPEKIRLNV
ncbi:MAG: Gfo/Idh/MocA family oxidoreductase [Candidatus Aminicenantes bacterium]|nr:Gfo/Idh/MocA family oxidoreductase [Candidatus Aminicenantes bacterium]